MTHVAAAPTLAIATLLFAPIAHAGSIVSSDPSTVAAWQSGCRTIGFDSMPGTTSFAPGTPVPTASQASDQFVACASVHFSSTGGPIAVVKVSGTSQQGDAKSQPNLVGGTLAPGPLVVINYLQPIHLQFEDASGDPAPVDKVGAWNDPTGSMIKLEVFDGKGALLESVTASQGFFLGIEHAAIVSATFSFVSVQSVVGFSLDDITVGGNGAIVGDLDGDGVVGGGDLGLLLSAWGTCAAPCCAADLDASGVIDGADLGIMLGAWG